MEFRIVLRGALAGVIAGIIGFVFAKIVAEPLVNQAIDYESGRDDVLGKLNEAAGGMPGMDGPEIFSRTIQSTVGIATGLLAFSAAMGALVAVAYVALHGRVHVRPRNLVWLISAFGFFGVFLLPFVKYPANPPAIGHEFTIVTRGHLYLTMVAGSLILLGLAVYLFGVLKRRFSTRAAAALTTAAFLIVFGLLVGLLPSPGDLQANVEAAHQFGFARAATETPQPITNILPTPLTIDGQTVAPGQIVYSGFDPDVLWKFRWYSILNQLLVWGSIALVFGWMLERFVGVPSAPSAHETPVPVTASG
jgi:Probable cobalt transporter subunit (CbtA)